HLLLAAAHLAAAPAGHTGEVGEQFVERLLGPPRRRSSVRKPARGLAADVEVLGDSESGENPAVLGNKTQAEAGNLVGAQTRDVAADEAHHASATRHTRLSRS